MLGTPPRGFETLGCVLYTLGGMSACARDSRVRHACVSDRHSESQREGDRERRVTATSVSFWKVFKRSGRTNANTSNAAGKQSHTLVPKPWTLEKILHDNPYTVNPTPAREKEREREMESEIERGVGVCVRERGRERQREGGGRRPGRPPRSHLGGL